MGESIVDRIKSLVGEAIELTGGDPLDETIEDDEFLPELIDSVGLSTLIVLIEEEWDITIDDDDIMPELFDSPSVLAGYVEKRLQSSARR